MIGFDFFLDHYGIFLSIVFVFIGLMSLIYGLATAREKGHRLEFYLMLFLIVGSGVGVALSHNLLLMYILWEISTFAVWRAVAYYAGPPPPESHRAWFGSQELTTGLCAEALARYYLVQHRRRASPP